jgi:hypothetical protein
MDVHVPQPITDQLRRRGVDVVTAIEDECSQLTDEALLEHARVIGRVLFTQDIRFKAMAEDWQRAARDFGGLLFGHQFGASLGQYIADLELISKATEPTEWVNVVAHLPL